MNKKDKLFEIADSQQGYFTSQQAEECGFSRSNFHLKIKAGEWIKQLRGIYKLASYPITDRSELALWMLWSRGRKGDPKGIWSHATALDIHELSDVMPSKMHMSVPMGFRRGNAIPKNLHLHFADIPKSDVEERQGYRVTTPLRTLIDVIQEGKVSNEHIAPAIKEVLEMGLATVQEIQKLSEWAKSIGKLEIDEIIVETIDDIWKKANSILADFGRAVEPYTIGLAFGDEGGPPFGTAVLVEYESKFFFLTACHVARNLRKAKAVRLILRFDDFRREYPARMRDEFQLEEWDLTFDEKMLDGQERIFSDHPKDLALICPTQRIIGILKEYKLFYRVSEQANFSKRDALVSLGGIGLEFSADRKTYHLNIGPWAFANPDRKEFAQVDYIVCPVSNNTYEIRSLGRKPIPTFQGLSGAGLWKCTDKKVTLIGIAIAQDPEGYDKKSGIRNVYFHGPKSILAALATCNKALKHYK